MQTPTGHWIIHSKSQLWDCYFLETIIPAKAHDLFSNKAKTCLRILFSATNFLFCWPNVYNASETASKISSYHLVSMFKIDFNWAVKLQIDNNIHFSL